MYKAVVLYLGDLWFPLSVYIFLFIDHIIQDNGELQVYLNVHNAISNKRKLLVSLDFNNYILNKNVSWELILS